MLGVDVVLSLEEQPLAALARIGTAGRPVITCLHRSDPEHQGPAVDALVADEPGVGGAARGAPRRVGRRPRPGPPVGIRGDLPRLYNAADLVVLTSAYGEAFFHRRQRLSEQRTFDAYARLLQQQVTGLPLGVAV